MRFEPAILERCSELSSGKPYAHSGLMRCAVLASMSTHSLSLATSVTASMAASSGRQRMAASAALKAFARAFASLRSTSFSVISSTSLLFAKRLRTSRPVVPASPSMKTFTMPSAMLTDAALRCCDGTRSGWPASHDAEPLRKGSIRSRYERYARRAQVVRCVLDFYGVKTGSLGG